MSLKAEEGVIGCLLIDNTVIARCPYLAAEMFQDEKTKYIFSKAKYLLDHDREVSAQSLATVCADKIDKTEMDKLAVKFTSGIGFSSEIIDYADDVLQDYKARKLKALVSSKQGEKFNSANIDDIISEFSTTLDDFEKGEETNESYTAEEMVRKFEKERFCKNRREFVYFGLPNLDEDVGGMEAGDMVVIAARPAVGKSAFAIQLITNFCRKGMKVGYFNIEMTSDQIYDRFMAHLSGIELKRIRTGTAFRDDEEERFKKANAEFKSFKLKTINGESNINDIRNDCKYNDFDIVVIDYLQLIQAKTRYSSRREEVGIISKGIKKIAMHSKIPVIVVSQLNRTKIETKEPTMSDLRESGDIEQDASIILMLWNRDSKRIEKNIKVEKNRQGETGTELMTFDGKRMRFTEVNTKPAQTTRMSPETKKALKSTSKPKDKLLDDNPFI